MIMFSFFKKENKQNKGPFLEIDLHSHLIPGIDDGSRSMDESLTLLKGMQDLGYKEVITTPHIMADTYRNTPETIKTGLKQLRDASLTNGIDIAIEAAAEYYLDDGFHDLLNKGEMLTLHENYLLFETSYIAKPLYMEEMIFEISSAGYKPVLAHPERYRYIKDPQKEFERLKELGVFFQVNLNSFGGHYGRSAQIHADFLSKNGFIDFLGSDVHHIKHVNTLSDIFYSNAYKKIFTHNTILNNELV